MLRLVTGSVEGVCGTLTERMEDGQEMIFLSAADYKCSCSCVASSYSSGEKYVMETVKHVKEVLRKGLCLVCVRTNGPSPETCTGTH